MKILTAYLHNWRSITDMEIKFDRMMVFIGQNNHGKSNILMGILFFFGEVSCEELDFRNGCDELYVELVFDELDQADKRTFKKYVSSDGTIRVRRSAIKAEGKCECDYHGYVEVPQEDWLKEDNVSNYTNRADAEATPLSEYIPASGRLTKAILTDAQGRYVNDHRDQLTFSYERETTNFLGTKNVAKGIWGDVFFIPAVKKATDEFATKSNTVFNQPYSRVLHAMSANSREFQNAKVQLDTLVRRLNKHTEEGEINPDRPEELTEFESLLSAELSDWDAKIDVEATPPDVDSMLKVGTNVWVDDGIRTDIGRKGQGLQRALILCLVRALAKLSEQDEAGEELARQASNSTFFVLEEPELFLHPQAQRAIFESLQRLSGTSQVIMSTHSSSFLSLDWYRSICRVLKRSPNSPTEVSQCTTELFQDADARKKFNMAHWINPDRSELFFAKKVILVEGKTDKTLIPLLAKKLDFYKHEYTLVDCGSKSTMPQYIDLLNYFSIPYTAVYDLDHQVNKSPDGIEAADTASQRIQAKISTYLGESVVFENDLEEELGIAAGNRSKPYAAVQHVSQEGFAIPPVLRGKIETIYI